MLVGAVAAVKFAVTFPGLGDASAGIALEHVLVAFGQTVNVAFPRLIFAVLLVRLVPTVIHSIAHHTEVHALAIVAHMLMPMTEFVFLYNKNKKKNIRLSNIWKSSLIFTEFLTVLLIGVVVAVLMSVALLVIGNALLLIVASELPQFTNDFLLLSPVVAALLIGLVRAVEMAIATP